MADEDEDMYEPTADDEVPPGPIKPKEESSEEDESEDDSDSVSSNSPRTIHRPDGSFRT